MARIIWHSVAPWGASGYGAQTAIWIRKLKEMGHEIVVSAYWGLSGSHTNWEGIPVLPGYGASYCSTSLRDHALAVNPDLIITLGDIWVMDPNILRDLPVAHWLPSDCRPLSTADRGVLEASGAELIAMSRFGFDRMRTAGFRPLYVPHGIDTNVFSPCEDKSSLREQMGAQDKFIIGINAANNDAVRKAIPEQMLAFAKFRQDHPDALLSLHTNVHQEGGQDLEKITESLGLGDCVQVVNQYHYAAGLIQPEGIARWYHSLDVMSACAFGEGFGLPIIEAQACGIPVIATDASSMPEVNALGVNVGGEPFWNGVHRGWWIKPSVPQMVAAYEKAYAARGGEHPELREFALRYDKDVVAEQYMKPAVEELLDRMGKRRAGHAGS